MYLILLVFIHIYVYSKPYYPFDTQHTRHHPVLQYIYILTEECVHDRHHMLEVMQRCTNAETYIDGRADSTRNLIDNSSPASLLYMVSGPHE